MKDSFVQIGDAAAGVIESLSQKMRHGIRTIADGEVITEPGIYDMSIEWYHADCCDGPSISSSGLRTIEMETPAHYWDASPLNPDRAPVDDKNKALNIGRAAHVLLLGESGFKEKFVLEPEEYTTDKGEVKPWSNNANLCKAWHIRQKALGKTVIKQADLDVIVGMARGLERDPIIRSGLFSGLTEKSLIWRDKKTGVWLKARPDTIQDDAALVVDLKTIVCADERHCSNAIEERLYHMQLALTGMGIKELIGIEIANDGYILVFVEKKRPFCANVKPVDAEAIMYGRMLLRRSIDKFAECSNSGDWHGYATSGRTAFLPAYATKRLRDAYEAGQLAEA